MTLIDSFGVCKVRASMDTLPRSSKKREGPEVPRLTSKIKEEEIWIWMITPTRKFSNRLVSVQSSEYAMPIRFYSTSIHSVRTSLYVISFLASVRSQIGF